MIAVPNITPVIAVTGLAFEARIAAGAGVTVVCGGRERLVRAIEAAIVQGTSGIISFGVAGGLTSKLAPGDWIVADKIVAGGRRLATDRRWSEHLLERLPEARRADLAGADAPVVNVAAKQALYDQTGAAAVDMESSIAGSIAIARKLPFAACRVIIDPADRALPAAALIGVRPDGTADVAAVLRSLAQQPSQLPDLVRTAYDAWTARAALLRGRRMLGERLGLPDFG